MTNTNNNKNGSNKSVPEHQLCVRVGNVIETFDDTSIICEQLCSKAERKACDKPCEHVIDYVRGLYKDDLKARTLVIERNAEDSLAYLFGFCDKCPDKRECDIQTDDTTERVCRFGNTETCEDVDNECVDCGTKLTEDEDGLCSRCKYIFEETEFIYTEAAKHPDLCMQCGNKKEDMSMDLCNACYNKYILQ